MSDFILKDGDLAMFLPNFGPAMVVVRPGTLSGSSPLKIGGKPACVSGDETRLSVPGCAYIAGPHVLPGAGTLTIDALANTQLAQKTKSKGKALILKGGTFTAKFQVVAPAQQPGPTPKPDTTTSYTGQGHFVTTNFKAKAT